MASEIGKIVHCKICGAPIEARGNRLYCPVCYMSSRRADSKSTMSAWMRSMVTTM